MLLPKPSLLDKVIDKVGYWIPMLTAYSCYGFIIASFGIVILTIIFGGF